ncbi:MAG: PqqD family protein [Nitrospinota bacterium]|nr:PqqD family protein [Nitrospinota bacterium]
MKTQKKKNTIWKLHVRARLDSSAVNGTNGNGGGILFDTYTAALLTCNSSAWTLLKLLSSGSTLQKLSLALINEYEVSKKDADQDIQNLLKQLEYMGLIDSAKEEK